MTWGHAIVVEKPGTPLRVIVVTTAREDDAWGLALNPGRTWDMKKLSPLLESQENARCVKVIPTLVNLWFKGKGTFPAGMEFRVMGDGILTKDT